ncbi:hypothetical protein SRRS_42860 [Sporomusa rhizae]|uniref:hypothetical protein n=1 Tax=Sporomusa rhizae TaxID=357999 RepID=UPI00352A5D0F
MKNNSRRKIAKRKYKRLLAALAGAAVVTSALLPGLPISKVHAADNTVVAAPAQTGETADTNKNITSGDTGDTNKNITSGDTSDTSKNITSGDTDKARERDKNRDKEATDAKDFAAASPVAAVKALAGTYGFDANNDSFSLQWRRDNEALVLVKTTNGQTYKVYLSKDNGGWAIDSVKEVITGGTGGDTIVAGNPVAVVKDNAATFGFDATNDRFSLLSITGGKAIVQVKTSGQTFKVDLERNNGNWVITTIRGIGNSKYPATYRPASLYGYGTLGAATGPIVTGGRTLYSNDAFAGWAWRESAYPANMKLGVLLNKPGTTTEVPSIIVDKVDSIDFGRQLVLYAHLGSVADRGYGIGIERVIQTGNDLTVTIRTKSPLYNTSWSSTKAYDIIPLDRLTLNFDNPIHINFVDQNGTSLSSYTLHTQ